MCSKITKKQLAILKRRTVYLKSPTFISATKVKVHLVLKHQVHQTPHRIFQTKMHPNQKIYKIVVVHQTPHKILQTKIHPNQKLRIKPKVLHK